MIQSPLHVAHTAYAVTGIVFLLACTRFVLRRLKNERIYPDDWLMVVALLLLIENTSTFPVLLLSSGNGSLAYTDDERISETELDKKIIFVSRVTYITYIWVLKVCILIYYYRLTARQPEQRYVRTASWGVAGTWTITMLLWMIQCRPFNLNWKIADPPPTCANGRTGLVFGTVSIIVTNIILIIIPLPMIWRTQMAVCTKLKVSGVFLVGIFLVVVSVMRTIMQEGGSSDPNDKYFWGELECLGMAFFTNAPIINALYRRYKSGPASSHLASRSRSRSARNTDDVDFCSVEEDSREMDFMEALRAFESESMKESGQGPIKDLPPAKLAPSPPNFGELRCKAIPNTNMLLSVSRSRGGGQRDSLHCLQSVEVVQESEPADPNNPMTPNALGGIGRVETKISHHDESPLPINSDLLDELYSSARRSMTYDV